MTDKLEVRLRARKTEHRITQLFGGAVCIPDETTTRQVLINPDGPEADDEITRLKGEVAAKQALIDELVEGLTDIGSTSRMPRRIRTLCLALISKARSSGKVGSDG